MLGFFVLEECYILTYKIGRRSRERLGGVHGHLVEVVEYAISLTEVDFMVLEGLRSFERQNYLKLKGASQTLKSRHLTGHAVDLGAYLGKRLDWSWPLYYKIAKSMKTAAEDLSIPLEWGGDWKSFKDGAHFQLARDVYPAEYDYRRA